MLWRQRELATPVRQTRPELHCLLCVDIGLLKGNPKWITNFLLEQGPFSRFTEQIHKRKLVGFKNKTVNSVPYPTSLMTRYVKCFSYAAVLGCV
jgi:hypothetical protein